MNTIESRTAARESLFLFAEVGVKDREPSRIKVRNLSVRGMMAVGDEPLREGEVAKVTLPRIGNVAGRCIWTRGQRFGFAFDREIDPRLARQELFHEGAEAPRYARAATFARSHGSRHGETLPV